MRASVANFTDNVFKISALQVPGMERSGAAAPIVVRSLEFGNLSANNSNETRDLFDCNS